MTASLGHRNLIMAVRIINLSNTYDIEENEVLIRVHRPRALGNPFILINEAGRDEVCDKYQQYFDDIVDRYKYGGCEAMSDSELDREQKFMDELHRIQWHLAQGKDVVLACFCAPRRCHSETIKAYLENESVHN